VRPACETAVISYRIELADLHAHQYRVTLSVPNPAPLERLSLPVWIPGSYLVREFGRHLSGLQAFQGQQARALQQLDKTTWQVACEGKAALVVSVLVYAFDNSVRTAFLGAARGFFNGTSLCLRVEGREQEPHRLVLGPLPRGWQVATALPAGGRPREFLATDYDELVDHPFELGAFWRGEFKVRGVPHGFVVAGAWHGFDGARLLADAQRICEAQVSFWHGAGKPPMAHYLFLLNTVDDGYGGLEHRASTALIAARRDLPRPGQPATEGYQTLLGLISHEYFHTWNVKRLKPQPFARYDYTRENYTELLWFFEGFTSYYDDLMLVRCGLIDEARYISLLGKTLNGVLGTPGRQVQSVAQASFDAWVKHYRSDENTPNATISYYSKGSLVALAFDLTLRSAGTGSLDDVMRALWAASGGGAIGKAEIALALQQVAGRPLAAELQAWVHGTEELPLAPLLAQVGLMLRHEALGLGAALGMRLSEGPVSGVQVRQVLRGSAAERAGVAAGDELLAVDGWRVRRFDDAAQWLAPGAAFELLLVRDQRVLSLQVAPDPTPPVKLALALAEPASKAAGMLRRAWLGG
jgi:predicted metalloprotease with PDZ domain